jgi:NADH:ubiquinone oxidoreductase subunit 3 (subunit A)
MSVKGIVIIILVIAAIPALFMLLVGVLGKTKDDNQKK